MTATDFATVPTAIPSTGGLRRLYADATALAASAMVTGLLGMAFWAVAARQIKPAELGVQTALLSLFTSVGLVVGSGVGDAFTALLPTGGPNRSRLLRHGYEIALLTSVATGALAALCAFAVLPQTRGAYLPAGLVGAGVVVWCYYNAQDSALTGMGKARWLPVENGAVSIAKVALLPVLVMTAAPYPMLIATLGTAVIAVVVVSRWAHHIAGQPSLGNAPAELADLRRLATRTTASISLTLGVLTILPFVVTATAGPVQGAVFALSLSITQNLDFLSAAIGVSLVVQASSEISSGAQMARQVLRRILPLVVLGAVAIVAVAPTALHLLNPTYVSLHGVAIIAVLCVGCVFRAVFIVWSALQRARRDMRPVLTLNIGFVIALAATLPLAAHQWGALGAAITLVSGQIIQSFELVSRCGTTGQPPPQ